MLMSRRTTVVAAIVILAVAAAVAYGRSGSGAVGQASWSKGRSISTPAGTFQTIVSKTVAVGGGPVLIRFSATGFEQDWNHAPAFVGRHYAAMRVRVLVNGTRLRPTVTLIDNAGAIGVKLRRTRTASYEWATQHAAGNVTVRVQFANLHTFDIAQIDAWTLIVQHG